MKRRYGPLCLVVFLSGLEDVDELVVEKTFEALSQSIKSVRTFWQGHSHTIGALDWTIDFYSNMHKYQYRRRSSNYWCIPA